MFKFINKILIGLKSVSSFSASVYKSIPNSANAKSLQPFQGIRELINCLSHYGKICLTKLFQISSRIKRCQYQMLLTHYCVI